MIKSNLVNVLFVFICTQYTPPKEDYTTPKEDVCSIDPGTFSAIFSNDGARRLVAVTPILTTTIFSNPTAREAIKRSPNLFIALLYNPDALNKAGRNPADFGMLASWYIDLTILKMCNKKLSEKYLEQRRLKEFITLFLDDAKRPQLLSTLHKEEALRMIDLGTSLIRTLAIGNKELECLEQAELKEFITLFSDDTKRSQLLSTLKTEETLGMISLARSLVTQKNQNDARELLVKL